MCVHMRTLTHTHTHGVLLSQKNKEQNLATCENMNRSTGYYAEWSKWEKEKYVWFHLHVECEKHNKTEAVTEKQSHSQREGKVGEWEKTGEEE